jgi:hypothetical protein
MAKQSTAAQIATLIRELHSERQNHLDAIAEIDATFGQLGISRGAGSTGKRGRGRPPGSGRRRGRRGSYQQTAQEFITSLFSSGKRLRTKQINEAWRSAGRGGTADNTLVKLVKGGQLSRKSVEGQRGSEYSLGK